MSKIYEVLLGKYYKKTRKETIDYNLYLFKKDRIEHGEDPNIKTTEREMESFKKLPYASLF